MNKIRTNLFILFSLIIGLSLCSYSLCNICEKTKSETIKEKEVTLMVQESRYCTGLKNIIKKAYVEKGIRVNVQIIPDGQADTIIRMKVNTGTMPDMIDSNIPHVYGLVNPTQYLENLSNERWVSKLKNTEMVTYSDGNIYAFPFQENSGVAGIIYNKDIFKQYDIKVPQNEEEFYGVCDLLIENNITPVLMCNNSWVPQMWMNYGFPLAIGNDKDCKEMASNILSKKKRITDYPELEEVINSYLNLFNKGYVNEDYLTINYSTMLDKMAKSQGAMIMGYSSMISNIDNTYKNLDVGIFNPPFNYVKDNVIVCPNFSIGFSVFRDSPNIETVKELLDVWSTPDYQWLWFLENSGFPAFEDVDGGKVNKDVERLYKKYVPENKTVNEFMLYLEPLYELNADKTWLYYLEAPKQNLTGKKLLEMMQSDIDDYLNN